MMTKDNKPYDIKLPRKYNVSGDTVWAWVQIVLYAGIILGMISYTQLTQPSASEITDKASAYGITQVTDISGTFNGCGSGDVYRYRFSGLDNQGVRRDWYYCAGLGKGATIRLR